MTIFDIVAIVLLIWFAINGFIKGLIVQLATLTALILGVWGASRFSGVFAGFLQHYFKSDLKTLKIIAFASIFLVLIIVVIFIGKGIGLLIKTLPLGFFNRLLGMLFALLKCAFILSVAIVIMEKLNHHYPFLSPSDIKASPLYHPLSMIAPKLLPMLGFDKAF
jgi:membrane protein required for colicin V production